MIKGYRIIKTRFVSSAFNGEGARQYGGRWNSIGIRMVYLAGSLSGATLELLVHTDDYSTIERLYSYIVIDIPKSCIQSIDGGLLPEDWNSPTKFGETQTIGDKWTTSMSSAVLKVPSAITAGESNFLANPLHPDFSKLKIGKARTFHLDPRI